MLTYLQLIRRLEIPLSFRRELLKLLRIDPESVQNLLDNGVPVETEQNQ